MLVFIIQRFARANCTLALSPAPTPMARRTSQKESSSSKRERSPSPPSSNEEEGIYTVERITQKRVDKKVRSRGNMYSLILACRVEFFI